MKFSLFSRSLLGLFSLVLLSSCNKDVAPNVLLINIDDLGWKDTGFMGNPYYATPHLDQLAQEGLVFEQAYAGAANCAPSRACLMSGKNTSDHGVFTVNTSERGDKRTRALIPVPNREDLDATYTTLAEAFKANQYFTATLGKWHLSDDPLQDGFDINIGGTHAGHPKSYFSPYRNPNLKDGPKGEYLTDRLTKEAIAILSERVGKEAPFFMYFPYFTIHTPLQGKPELVEKYKEILPENGKYHPQIGAMVENMDRNIGLLLDALEANGQLDNTLIIFTSDNGGIRSFSTQEPLRAGKGSYYEGGIRVPTFFYWKGKIQPGRSQAMISQLDFYPTLMEAIGEKPAEDLDGVSLLPILKNEAETVQDTLYWHFPIYLEAYRPKDDMARDPLFRTRPGSVIRAGKWKLHYYYEDQAYELYNLESDLGETNNCIAQNPDVAARLKAALWKRIQADGNILPLGPNPDYDPEFTKAREIRVMQ